MNKNIIVCLILILMFVSGCGKAEKQVEMPEKIAPEATKCSFESLPEQEKEHGCKQFCEKSGVKESENENNVVNEIDLAEQKCIEKAGTSNIAMGNCVYISMEAWYKEIEKNLKILKEIMLPEQYKQLELSQKNWENYVKSEFDLYDTVIFHKIGSIYYPMNAAKKNEIIKKRAIDIEGYIHYMKQP